MKRQLLSTLLILTLSAPLFAQSTDEINQMLETAQRLMDETKESEALSTYMEVLDHDPENYKALWNGGLLNCVIGFRYDDEDTQKEYFTKALKLAQKGVDLYPDSVDPRYVVAVAKGRLADVVGTRERIRLSHEIEESVRKALEIDPDHAPSLHLYGVWNSEVANLSRGERFAARFISRGLPNGSNEKAEKLLKKAVEQDPDNILIRLDLARHYIRIDEESSAISWLEELLEMEPATKDDPDYIATARELLEDLR